MDISNKKIRKIICGTDPLKALVFLVGKRLTNDTEISSIEYNEYHQHKYGAHRYDVFIQKESGNSTEVFLWKTIIDVPAIIEYDCDF
jgi:hypothetical protein